MLGFLLLPLSAIMVIVAAQNLCDPQKQYEANGVCCRMCDPGTKMVDQNCDAPRCEPCDSDEYRETYTTQSKCERQPYCDPNRNFAPPVHVRTKKTVCMCRQGFHCSSQSCTTCNPHNPCGPGEGVLDEGNQTHNTVCHRCPEGTFSGETSLSQRCVEHTKCALGSSVEVAGTNRSDTVCVKNTRRHIVIAVVAVVLAVSVGILAGVLLHLRRKRGFGDMKQIHNGTVESIGPQSVPRDESATPMMPPQTPVETEDSSILSTFSEEHGRSENGKIVCSVQEEGKVARLPRQESHVSSSSTVSFG